MAVLEERIFIARLTQDPYTCDIGGICKGEKCLSEQCQRGMTRQEAIEVMAKAIMSEFFLSTEGSIAVAETALNALLGVEK